MKTRTFTAGATSAQQVESVREGIYVTFISLAVTLVLLSHHDTNPYSAMTLLGITALSTVVAGFTADVLSQLVVHDRTPARGEILHSARASLGALVVVIIPLASLATSAIGWFPLEIALAVAATLLIVTLVVIVGIAIRGIRAPLRNRLMLLGVLAGTGSVVVTLLTFAHA